MLLAAAEKGGEKGGHHMIASWEGLMIYVGILVALVLLVLGLAQRGMTERVYRNWFTSRFEQLVGFIENLCVGVIGSHGRHYVPIITAFWLVIFFANLISLFSPFAPTMDLSFNLALALCSIGYVQYEGMRANGVLGHFKHFAGPKLGIALIPITAMIFIIEIISEVMKNISLSVRIYGNIFGGHEATDAMNKLAPKLIPLGNGEYLGIPVGAFLIPVKLLTCIVQALVFCLLTCVYLSLVTHHEEEHGHDDHGHDDARGHTPAHA